LKRVTRISVTPVKGFRLAHPDEVRLGPDGVAGNRRFFLVDADGERLRSSLTPWPVRVRADYDAASEQLRMHFPDGSIVEGAAVANGDAIHSTAGTIDVTGRLVHGPWDQPLSHLAGGPVRLARADRTGAGMNAPVTLVSDGSLARVAREAGRDTIDSRRFRMLFELEDCESHEEDAWEGRSFEIGSAVVRVGGPVDRCAVTTRDPETGERDLDTLRLLKNYRGQRESDGAVLFGVYAWIERPGIVRVGDTFAPL
jgi:MOSC domain-containing protein